MVPVREKACAMLDDCRCYSLSQMELNDRVDVKNCSCKTMKNNGHGHKMMHEILCMPGKMIVGIIVIQKWTNARVMTC